MSHARFPGAVRNLGTLQEAYYSTTHYPHHQYTVSYHQHSTSSHHHNTQNNLHDEEHEREHENDQPDPQQQAHHPRHPKMKTRQRLGLSAPSRPAQKLQAPPQASTSKRGYPARKRSEAAALAASARQAPQLSYTTAPTSGKGKSRATSSEARADRHSTACNLTLDLAAPAPSASVTLGPAGWIREQRERREKHAQANPFFLMCTKRVEHKAGDFSPMTRFGARELGRAINEMERLLAAESDVSTSSAPDPSPSSSSLPEISYGWHNGLHHPAPPPPLQSAYPPPLSGSPTNDQRPLARHAAVRTRLTHARYLPPALGAGHAVGGGGPPGLIRGAVDAGVLRGK
ncbi:hypothetical protein DXG01_005473, partial [Tephrocybe rancida]